MEVLYGLHVDFTNVLNIGKVFYSFFLVGWVEVDSGVDVDGWGSLKVVGDWTLDGEGGKLLD